MHLYVMGGALSDVVTGVHDLEALQRWLDSGLEKATLTLHSRKETLSSECAVVEVSVDEILETDSEDLTSDSDAAPDANEDSGEDQFATLVEDLDVSVKDDSVSGFSGED